VGAGAEARFFLGWGLCGGVWVWGLTHCGAGAIGMGSGSGVGDGLGAGPGVGGEKEVG
jgi:hypothetical protein